MGVSESIFINGRFLGQELSGVQRFAREIIEQLSYRLLNLVILAPKSVKLDSFFGIPIRKVGISYGYLWEQFELPIYLLAKGSPLLINFGNIAPAFYRRQIITLHDIAFILHKEWYSKSFKTIYGLVVPIIVKRSLHILTVSKTEKKNILHQFNINDSRISVLYNGIPSNFLNLSPEDLLTDQIKEPYILSVASFNPRKNLSTLISAFERLGQSDLQLVLVGRTGKAFGNIDLDKHIADDSRIIHMSDVDDLSLARLYYNAKAFIFIPFYEGFGIPLIEASFFGCPVICSDLEVFKEIGLENMKYVNPLKTEEIANAMQEVLNSNKRREIVKGEGFDYKNSAEILFSIIDKYTSKPL
ncbi:MAG: glycosyltransferase family 1 protein [Bacteroidota bacterium]